MQNVLKEIDAYYNENGNYLCLTAFSENDKIGGVTIENIGWDGVNSILAVLNSLNLLECWMCTKKGEDSYGES